MSNRKTKHIVVLVKFNPSNQYPSGMNQTTMENKWVFFIEPPLLNPKGLKYIIEIGEKNIIYITSGGSPGNTHLNL